MDIGKTVLYLIKSNGKRNKPTDKQKTVLKNKLKTELKTKQKNQRERKTRNVILERKQFFDCITKNSLERIGTLN